MPIRFYPTAPAHVYLFATCLVDFFVPRAGPDTVRLLEWEGLSVHFPRGQSCCCGQPVYSSGDLEEVRNDALPTRRFRRAVAGDRAIWLLRGHDPTPFGRGFSNTISCSVRRRMRSQRAYTNSANFLRTYLERVIRTRLAVIGFRSACCCIPHVQPAAR